MKYLIVTILFILTFHYKAISSFQNNQNRKTILKTLKFNDKSLSGNIPKDINTNNLVKQSIISGDEENRELNTISGNVYMGENLLPEGEIYIIEHNRGTYVIHKSFKIVNGNYKFSKLKSGSYTLYVIPDFDYNFLYFPKYIPTYSGDSFKWESSVEKNVSKGITNFSIHLQSYSDPFCGNEKISGKISFENGYKGGERIPVPVILLNHLKKPMDFRIADSETGEFVFEYLPIGTYYIHPEIPGIRCEDYKITLRQENNSNHDINFNINNENITYETYEEEEIEEVQTGKYIKIFLDENISSPIICELFGITGKSVSKNIYQPGEIKINTANISAGIYILRVRTYDNKHIKNKKIYINNYN